MNVLWNNILGIEMAFAQAADKVAGETENQLTGLVTYIVQQIPLWITALIVIAASFVAARIVKNAVENKMTAEGFEEEHKEIQIVAGRTANAAVLLFGVTAGLKIAGLDLTPVIAAAAFGIGFALQDLIMNFLAGVMVLTARHYTIGDVIKVNGTIGKIMEIQTRATVLKAFDGTKIIVPNADLFTNQVTSLTSNPFRRIQLINGVAYGSDLKKTSEVVMNAVKETNGVLVEPKPSMFFYEWGDSSINFKVNAWVETRGGWIKIRNRLIMNIDKALGDAGIEIPYPIQTILMGKEAEGEENKMEGQVVDTMKEKIEKPKVTKTGVNPEYMEATEWLKKTIQQVVPPAPALAMVPVAAQVSKEPASSNPLFFAPATFPQPGSEAQPENTAQPVPAPSQPEQTPAPVAVVQPAANPVAAAPQAPENQNMPQ